MNLKENKLLFNQLPLVEFEGKKMVQSCAVARYAITTINFFNML